MIIVTARLVRTSLTGPAPLVLMVAQLFVESIKTANLIQQSGQQIIPQIQQALQVLKVMIRMSGGVGGNGDIEEGSAEYFRDLSCHPCLVISLLQCISRVPMQRRLRS